jgi:hydroxyacylglutathione hydrolase
VLAGGVPAWRAEGRELASVERLAAADLPARREREPELQLLDVRDRGDWEAGHLAGSTHRSWRELDAIPAPLDPAKPIAVLCSSGQRAATAASLLQHHGAARAIHVVDGGVPTLRELGQPLETA